MPPTETGVAPELNDVVRFLDDLEVGRADALTSLRTALRRVVAAPSFSGSVKTAIVQALLLLDDPRVGRAGAPSGASLLLKIRKLVTAACDAHAENAAETPASRISQIEFSPDALLSPGTDRALLDEFVIESREQLEIAESALLALDTCPDDVKALDALFRALHTIKGTSAFLGVEHATELAHHAESLLGPVRTGVAVCTGKLSSLLFRSIDMLDAMLVSIERAAEGEAAMLPDGFRPLLEVLRHGTSEPGQSPARSRTSGSVRRLRAVDTSVRVRSADLDRLVGVVRELVLTHAMLSRDNALRAGLNQELARKVAHAERLAFELEDLASELRTVDLTSTMQKLARISRDTAYQSGKTIEFSTDGDDILVERTMAAAIAGPLLHMVRNAIDHGIESADERRLAGKPEAGQLRIVAQRLGAHLVIEVRDDGRGMSAAALVRRAQELGIEATDARLSDQDAYALIFRPGFSTSRVVTELSGRGVGMDVVRTNVEAAGGSIDIASRTGHGTTFTIRLPFRSHPVRGAPQWADPTRTIGLTA